MKEAKAKSALIESGRPANEFSALIVDWLVLYAANYGKEPTEENALLYRTGLSDLEPKLLHEAFVHCLKESKFWPTVAEVREAYARAREASTPKTYYLPELEPVWTEEDRKKWAEDIAKVIGKKAMPPPLSEADLQKRFELLRQQAEQLKAKETPC